jgi:hypothetical protein
MKRDAHLIFENYSKIAEAQAAPAQAKPATPAAKRLKDLNAFNTNLNAIDAFEDKTNALIETAVKTGFFNQQESAQAKQVLGGSIAAFLMSLVTVTEVKTAQDIQQMKKAITDKIKGIDVAPIVQALDKMVATMQPQAPAATPAPTTPVAQAPSPTTQTPAVPPIQIPTRGS